MIDAPGTTRLLTDQTVTGGVFKGKTIRLD